MESNFSFLKSEYPILTNLGILAEKYIHYDPNSSLFKLRLFGEKTIETIFEIHQLDFPYENTAFRRLELLKDEGKKLKGKDKLNISAEAKGRCGKKIKKIIFYGPIWN